MPKDQITDSEDTAQWLDEMKLAGMTIQQVPRTDAKRLLFSYLPAVIEAYGRMIVARRQDGEVEAAGWDCTETRKDARGWLRRGLTLEFVSRDRVIAIADSTHIFATKAPVGEVLTHQQALNALVSY